MSVRDLTDPKAVQAAIDEFDRLGRDGFLATHGFGKADRFYLRSPDGRLYDSKAIAGVAYGYQFPDRGTLQSATFSGGEMTVKPTLEGLGFEIVEIDGRDPGTQLATDGRAAGATASQQARSVQNLRSRDILLLKQSRLKRRYADLSEEERDAYRRVDLILRELGNIVQRRLGSSDEFGVKLTSGFTPASGVRGAMPKDLWFGVYNIQNLTDFVGMPQLFAIVSERGVEYGFAPAIHPYDFSQQGKIGRAHV